MRGGERLRFIPTRANRDARGAVVVYPDRDGATADLRDLTHHLAFSVYAALLLDPFSRHCGTDAVPVRDRAALLGNRESLVQGVGDVRAAAAYLAADMGLALAQVGVLGLGFGGLVAWQAAQAPNGFFPRAVVLYSPMPDSLTHAKHLKAAVLMHFRTRDRRAVTALPALRRRLRAAGCVHALRVHPDSGRAFWGERGGTENCATAAWQETLAWFERHLRPPTIAASH